MERTPIHPFLAGLGANLLGSVTGAFFLTISGFTGQIEGIGDIVGGTVGVAFYGFIIALPFILAYGMPTYALLNRYGVANLGMAILFGSMPGLAWVLCTHSSWIDPVLWNGTLIAIFYFILRRWSNSNNNRGQTPIKSPL